MESDKSISESSQTIPLVMLYGIFGRPDNWKAITPLLPRNCQPIAFPIPFFDKGTKLTTVPAVVDYVQRYLEEKQFERIVLMGNSFGGHLGSLLAARMPEKVCGLVLTGSSGLFSALFEKGYSKIPGIRPKQEWVRKKAEEVFYDPCHVSNEMMDDIMAVVRNFRKVKKLIQLARATKRDNIQDRIKLIRCPTLLIWGKQDNITPPETAQEFKKYIPDSELFWIDKCGHAPMIEYPQEFTRILNIWWEKNFSQEKQESF